MKTANILMGLAIAAGLCAAAGPSRADEAAPDAPKGFWDRDTLTGDWGGLRTDLAERGIKVGAAYTAEALGNASGGIRRRAVGNALLQVDVDADLEQAVGWTGCTSRGASCRPTSSAT
jgi:porin